MSIMKSSASTSRQPASTEIEMTTPITTLNNEEETSTAKDMTTTISETRTPRSRAERVTYETTQKMASTVQTVTPTKQTTKSTHESTTAHPATPATAMTTKIELQVMAFPIVSPSTVRFVTPDATPASIVVTSSTVPSTLSVKSTTGKKFPTRETPTPLSSPIDENKLSTGLPYVTKDETTKVTRHDTKPTTDISSLKPFVQTTASKSVQSTQLTTQKQTTSDEDDNTVPVTKSTAKQFEQTSSPNKMDSTERTNLPTPITRPELKTSKKTNLPTTSQIPPVTLKLEISTKTVIFDKPGTKTSTFATATTKIQGTTEFHKAKTESDEITEYKGSTLSTIATSSNPPSTLRSTTQSLEMTTVVSPTTQPDTPTSTYHLTMAPEKTSESESSVFSNFNTKTTEGNKDVLETTTASENNIATKGEKELTTAVTKRFKTTMESKTSRTLPQSSTERSTETKTLVPREALHTTDHLPTEITSDVTSLSSVPLTREIPSTDVALFTSSVPGTTPLNPSTDLSNDLKTKASSQTYGTDSSTVTIPKASSQSTELATVDASTETPSTRPPWCDGPCPQGYVETERGCFIMVPEEFRQNFMSAFMWCRSEDRRDLSDQDDIMTSNMIETLKYMLRLNGIRSDIIYLNGHADKLMRKEKKAGLIHLEEISIWDNLPTEYVGISTDIVNVTGSCRMPKYCETPVCDLSAVYKFLPEKVEEVDNRTIEQGSGIRLKCLYPSRDFLNVRCIDPGELMPSPTLLRCTIPADVKYEPPEKEVTGNMRIRDNCSDCYDDGTANCTAEGAGYVCNCKDGWNKFTCYKSIDLCPPQYCGPNGNCLTQLDEFFCNCSAGWIGDKCDVNIKKITWGGNKTLRIISTNTIAGGLLGLSSGIQISLKVLSKVITDTDPEDPQEAFQAFRSTCLAMGNIAIALFQHPDLLSSAPISCRWFFFFVHICYSLAFVFILDEVLNVCTTIHGLHRNNWVRDNKNKKRWWLGIPARIQLPFVIVFALLWYVASQGWSKIPATWTCFGVFKRETSNIWYPLVLFNFVSIVLCFGFAENARRTLSHRIQFWTANMHLVDVTNPYIRESIEKVRRNVPYCFLLPPFMFLNWLFLCWAADQQTDTVKFLSLLFSGCYTVLSMLQTLETSTGIYEYVVYYGHLYLPNCISNRILQDLTPMTWLSKPEIVAKKRKTVFNGLDASSPYHPASICYITLEHEHLMLRRMSREYLDHRVTHYSKQDEATLSVYFNELRLRHVYEKNVPLEDLHLELILETWIADTKRIDQLTIPPKAKKQKETWRTRIRAKNRIPPMENTNIRRMRFLKICMDYHLKTLNPTLEYPVTGAMQRTDFRTFSPACPCVLRSQVEDLQRTWLPIIDIYIEQDWSLREVYKEVLEAEGHKPRNYECKKGDLDEDHWLNELRPGFIGPRSYPLVYLPALGTYLELDYYQRFADLEWARLVKHSEYLGACYDFGRPDGMPVKVEKEEKPPTPKKSQAKKEKKNQRKKRFFFF